MKQKKQKEQTASVSLWQLFYTFFKVGLFTFGGGYAMIAILEEELITKKKWITEQDMLDMLVIAESTPGVIAVNTATSVGYKMRGIVGALMATLGVVLPSFVIIFALSYVIQAFQANPWYKAAFTGIRACVTILVINAFTKLFHQVDWDLFGAIVFVISLWVAVLTDFDVIFLILIGGALGIVYTLIKDAVQKKKALPLAESQRLNDDGSAPIAAVEHKNDDTYAQNCNKTQDDATLDTKEVDKK